MLRVRLCACVSAVAPAQAFARGCTLLRTLRLHECKQVSDVGLLQVSNHCPALETLDVSRTEVRHGRACAVKPAAPVPLRAGRGRVCV
jgi:hypothetical protein